MQICLCILSYATQSSEIVLYHIKGSFFVNEKKWVILLSYQPSEQKYWAFIFVRQTFFLQSKEIDFCFIMRWSCIVRACKTKFSLFVMRYM